MKLEKIKIFSKDPFLNMLGVKIEESSEGYAKVSLTATDSMVNFNGAVHGAVIFALADAAFSIACNYSQKKTAVSASISFLSAATAGDTLIAEANCDKQGKKIGGYSVKVFTSAGKLVAAFSGVSYTIS